MELFPTTRWSILARATLNGENAAREALAEFCRRYHAPIQQVLRIRGVREEDIDDLTHDFFLQLLQSSSLKRADRERGRFRSFLSGALVHFLADQQDRRQALKRGGGSLHVSLDESPSGTDITRHALQEAPPSLALEFDRSWALNILNASLAEIQSEYADAHNPGVFTILQEFLPGARQTMSYDEAATRLGRPLATVKSDVLRLRRRLRDSVRRAVAQTVDAPHEIDSEMRHLQAVLLDRGSDLIGLPSPTSVF
jgi:RNA polymerase sigma-70 factor (ECF subfamily)